MKLQSSLERAVIISVVVVMAIIILTLLYTGVVKFQKSQDINYVSDIIFGNIYNNNNTMFIMTKNNLTIGKNITVYFKIKGINGSQLNITSLKYNFISSYNSSDGEKIYEFKTGNFSLKFSNTTYLNVNISMIKTSKTSIEPTYDAVNHITYYPATVFSSLKMYILNTTLSPSNGGVASPKTQYYYSGTKVVINASSNNGYGFVDWYGYGIGNYSGSNESQVITVNDNITEIARFGIKVPVKFNETAQIPTPFILNLNKYVGNTTLYLTSGLNYKYSFPSVYVNTSSGIEYALSSVTSTCGYSGNNQTINVSYTDNNCEILANYTKLVSVMISEVPFNGGGSGQVYPASGYYKIGSIITINAIPNENSAFFRWIGSGYGSYSGSNQSQNIEVINPINETAVFGRKVPVYVDSNIAGTKIEVGGINYTTNAVANLVFGATYSLSSRSELLNWGTRVSFMNYTGTTCHINSNGTVTINQSGCMIKENFQKQYLLLIMESLNGGTPQNTTKYGNLNPGNYTWENVGANVTIGAYQNAGYGFLGFSGKYGSGNYSGYNSYPDPIYPDSASASATQNINGNYNSCQYSESTSISFENWVYAGNCYTSINVQNYMNPEQVYTLKSAHVKMNEPAIEVANYNTNNNYVATGTYNIAVNYVYENYTFTNYYNQTSQQNSQSSYFTEKYSTTENPVDTESGTLNISVAINQPIENWTPQLGSVTDTYATESVQTPSSQSYSEGGCSDSSYYTQNMGSSYSGVANVTIENLTYMSPYFISTVDQIISETRNELANEYNLKYQSGSGGIWFTASFKIANATVYYNEAPNLPKESSTYSGWSRSTSGSCWSSSSDSNWENSMYVSGYTNPGIS